MSNRVFGSVKTFVPRRGFPLPLLARADEVIE
jgi:hypothetical protein